MNIVNHRRAVSSFAILLFTGAIAATSAQAAVEQRGAPVPSADEGITRTADGFVTRLWERTAGMTERAVDFANAGWERFENRGDAMRAALVDAKMHLDYARIDQVRLYDPESARTEIARAQADLDQALENADMKVTPRIQAIRDDIGEIVPQFEREGSSHYRQLQAEYRNFETELQDLISGKYGVAPQMHEGA